ncbi:MAG: TIGR03087 family PEP-CTERM/XrtA system glycosyltransferase, partial [Planctomycetes bacterium]|nr:TIGR03087 family PEP-CTERM/XrtA system glycosyltransferase [Planctomycetota bacterium]
ATQGYFHSPRLRRALHQTPGDGPFDLAIGYSSSTLDLLTAAPARARIMDLVDVDSAKWAGYAQSARPPKNWLYRMEADRVRRLERRAVHTCEAVLVVSEAEISAMEGPCEKIHAVGNGVDLDFFAPADPPADDRPSLVFTGTMDYRPNAEGVCWFVKQVWPVLRKQLPTATFTIVGRDPTVAVRRLANVPGVYITGTVADVRPYLAAASVAVAPLLIARGIQNKVLEAMAIGRAVVASPAALEGLDVRPGSDVLAAETPQQWQQCLTQLLTDAARRKALGLAARQLVERLYSWPARMSALIDLCRQLTE